MQQEGEVEGLWDQAGELNWDRRAEEAASSCWDVSGKEGAESSLIAYFILNSQASYWLVTISLDAN